MLDFSNEKNKNRDWRKMRPDRPVFKSFRCAAGIFVVLYSIVCFFDLGLILWHGAVWAVLGIACALAGLADGIWAFYRSRTWSWKRHIITCLGFCIIWLFVINLGLCLEWQAHPTFG